MKYIDTHAHINVSAFDADRDEVIGRTAKEDILVINVGTQQTDSKLAVTLAASHPHLYAIVGLHPIHVDQGVHDHDQSNETISDCDTYPESFDKEYYLKLAQSSDKVVGIGECGLDYFRNTPETKQAQEIAFRAQIELALELDLPLMLHVRPSKQSMDAYEDALSILREYSGNSRLRGQAHFFAGTIEIAKEFMSLGFYISFTGVITFAGMYEKLVKAVPMDKILSETDAPYVTPHPYRGQRNEPLYVREVLGKIARIKKVGESEMADQVMKNAQNLYKLNG